MQIVEPIHSPSSCPPESRLRPGEGAFHSLVPPLVQSTTFRQEGIGADPRFSYSRCDNPTVAELEVALSSLEGAAHASAFSSGLAATHALAVALLRHGDHVVCGEAAYGGTVRLLRDVLGPLGVRSTLVDATHEERVVSAVGPDTRFVIIETPANPTLDVCDIARVAEGCRESGVPLVVDNTFLTSALQRPLELGATASLYSTTKWIEGHNLAVGGAIVTDDPSLDERLRWVRKSVGSIQAPFDAWLTLRGLQTLRVRLVHHSASAERIVDWLSDHPAVRRVGYPTRGPRAAIARRQQSAGGGVLCVETVGGLSEAKEWVGRLQRFALAENLGATQSLVTHPASMTHPDIPTDVRGRVGITDGLVRLSVGLEPVDELLADLGQALSALEEVGR